MGIVYQENKKTGITYVYKNEAYWDKEKQQSRAKRKLIGKVDHDTGEILPTRSYQKKQQKDSSTPMKPGPVSITKICRKFYGASYLLDQIGQITGIVSDLKECFPDRYKQILSIAYYLILEENNSLSRFSQEVIRELPFDRQKKKKAPELPLDSQFEGFVFCQKNVAYFSFFR